MKIALVHDGLFNQGGAEKILLLFTEAFPSADIFTSIYNEEATYPEFTEKKINTTWLSHLANDEKQYKSRFFPFAILAMLMLDLRKYDIVLMATTNCSKYIRFSKKSKVFAYTFTPFRLAFNPDSYSLYSNAKGAKKIALKLVVKMLKAIDIHYSKRIPNFIAMTEETQQRLSSAYGPQNEIPILNPPIDVEQYYPNSDVDNYYLLVSRLEKYKKVDLVIEAFNRSKKELMIVGRGTEKENLKSLAGRNITFMEGVSNNDLSNIYSKAKALIFPQHEDYGLTPLESAASGRPVIGYGFGGILETMIPYTGTNERTCTAIFFRTQSIKSLNEAIEIFENLSFDTKFIRNHAERFHKDKFIKNIQEIVLG
jgi:glycosyltransferase involved in cell wall biosynthesis